MSSSQGDPRTDVTTSTPQVGGGAAAGNDELRPGTRLGQYELLERLGAGGMGEVFKAIHPTMQRVVAVKVMAHHLVADARARARFLREVRSAARLVHPNIVMAFDAAEEGERCFLVMEYVEGWDLAALMRTCGLPPVALACEIMRQAALGLEHAYEEGVVHRDIKPGNLIVAPRRAARDASASSQLRDGPHPGTPPGWPTPPIVKILDLGLARLIEAQNYDGPPLPGHTPLTREGFVVGTPEFMSPEQASNSLQIDIRSDIYSLGCTFYCLLSGKPPFTGNSLLEVMVQHMQLQPEPVAARRPDIPPGVSAVLARMMAKKPEHRYQTPAELADALQPFALTPGTLTPVGLIPPPPPPVPMPPPSPRAAAGTPTEMLPTPARPAAPAPARVPQPPPRPGFFARLFRTAANCAGLLLLIVLTSVGGILFLLRDRLTGDAANDDGPRQVPALNMALVPLPAGPFAPSYGAPRTSLSIRRRFEIATTEVTHEQFLQFAKAKGYQPPVAVESDVVQRDGTRQRVRGASWDNQPPDAAATTPAVCVTWDEALIFCNWLSERDGKPPCYKQSDRLGGGWECDVDVDGYRLPTEAEWEYAARGGAPALLPSADAELRLHAWLREDADGPRPVGGKKASGRGLHDLWGNVWEWCWDRYANEVGPSTPPTGPAAGNDRVARGGGWSDTTAALRKPGGTRLKLKPETRATDLGFRVARTLP